MKGVLPYEIDRTGLPKRRRRRQSVLVRLHSAHTSTAVITICATPRTVRCIWAPTARPRPSDAAVNATKGETLSVQR